MKTQNMLDSQFLCFVKDAVKALVPTSPTYWVYEFGGSRFHLCRVDSEKYTILTVEQYDSYDEWIDPLTIKFCLNRHTKRYHVEIGPRFDKMSMVFFPILLLKLKKDARITLRYEDIFMVLITKYLEMKRHDR